MVRSPDPRVRQIFPNPTMAGGAARSKSASDLLLTSFVAPPVTSIVCRSCEFSNLSTITLGKKEKSRTMEPDRQCRQDSALDTPKEKTTVEERRIDARRMDDAIGSGSVDMYADPSKKAGADGERAAAEKKVVRKLDICLVPILGLMFMMNLLVGARQVSLGWGYASAHGRIGPQSRHVGATGRHERGSPSQLCPVLDGDLGLLRGIHSWAGAE